MFDRYFIVILFHFLLGYNKSSKPGAAASTSPQNSLVAVNNESDSPIVYEDCVLNCSTVADSPIIYDDNQNHLKNNISVRENISDGIRGVSSHQDLKGNRQHNTSKNTKHGNANSSTRKYSKNHKNNFVEVKPPAAHLRMAQPSTSQFSRSQKGAVNLVAFPWEEYESSGRRKNPSNYQEAVSSEYSYVVIIGHMRDDASFCGRCAGSLFTNMHVITLARCFVESYYDESGKIRTFLLSEYFVRINSRECNAGGTVLGIEDVYMHPTYADTEFGLAILQLSVLIDRGSIALAVPPPMFKNEKVETFQKSLDISVFIGSTCQLLGWTDQPTQDAFGTSIGDTQLKQMDIKIVNWTKCSVYDSKLDGGELICGEAVSRQTSPCPFIMGSPLVCQNVEYGLLVWGLGCDLNEEPLVFARTDAEEEWIREIVLSTSKQLRSTGTSEIISSKLFIPFLTFLILYKIE